MKAFLTRSIPDLISEDTVFEAALLCEESGTDGGLFIGLKIVGDLRSLSKLWRGNAGMRDGPYEAKDDRRFADSGLACKRKRMNGRYEG